MKLLVNNLRCWVLDGIRFGSIPYVKIVIINEHRQSIRNILSIDAVYRLLAAL